MYRIRIVGRAKSTAINKSLQDEYPGMKIEIFKLRIVPTMLFRAPNDQEAKDATRLMIEFILKGADLPEMDELSLTLDEGHETSQDKFYVNRQIYSNDFAQNPASRP